MREESLLIDCAGDRMVGILHRPEVPGSRGVVIVVGGPQYRIGSHRQFLLLARDLAANGIPVLRFDCRGMGDSDGAERSFENIQDDMRRAVDELIAHVPNLDDVVLWGLCDAASAAMMNAYTDERVSGIVLLNPWVRSDTSLAKTYLRHYYLSRLLQREFWSGLARGRVNPLRALGGLFETLQCAVADASPGADDEQCGDSNSSAGQSYITRMRDGLSRFHGRVLLILSGEDLTAAEFRDLVKGSKPWRRLLADPRVSQVEIPDATHTFSRRKWRDEVAVCTAEWISSW